ncbi:MAG: glycosyltransferase, partial [Bacteroidaceae bacterium]|nr:glycosyltransferase [Bacteroidaceae bacterium]
MSKVTVLVAAYNACKYLAECLDSLAGQTLKDIQIVCIDDASTDS